MVGNFYIWMSKSLVAVVESESKRLRQARVRLEEILVEMKQMLGTDLHPAFHQMLNRLVNIVTYQKDYKRAEEVLG